MIDKRFIEEQFVVFLLGLFYNINLRNYKKQ